jgi:2,5-diamino-6-(ribosylamino)-4(3H)-pyrimidinone 5'-phosphate reductase
MSLDGKIALPSRRQIRISSEEDMKRVFQLRNSCDAILVGIGSVLADDPKLTVKESYVQNPKQPVRVVLDSYCKTPENALVVNKKAKTILVVQEGQVCTKNFGEHVEIIECPVDNGLLDLSVVLTMLSERNINTVLVEGGGTVIWNFLRNAYVDELFVFIGSMVIGGSKSPTMVDGEGILSQDDTIGLHLVDMTRMQGGVLLHYQLSKNEI